MTTINGKIVKFIEEKHHDDTASLFVQIQKDNGNIASIECLFYAYNKKGFLIRDFCLQYIVKIITKQDIQNLTITEASYLLNSTPVIIVKEDGMITSFGTDINNLYSPEKFVAMNKKRSENLKGSYIC